jgi:glutathione S-transferase
MVSVLLEELKAAYDGFDYETIAIDFGKNEQKSDWFIKINPNGSAHSTLGEIVDRVPDTAG